MTRVCSIGKVLVAGTAALVVLGLPSAIPNLCSAEQVPIAFRQNWIGAPLLPVPFADSDLPPGSDQASQDDLGDGLPPRPPGPVPAGPRGEDTEASPFPTLMSVLELDRWRQENDLRRIKEFVGDVTLGLPLLVPQLVLEEFLPRGVAVGPLTYLYRTPKDSKTMPLVVVDQAIFHEGEFLAQVQAAGTLGLSDSLMRSERQVLRRSLMSGFRASYTLPAMTLEHLLETAGEEGVWGYLLVPAAGGALLFLKGLDQKFTIDDVVKARIVVTSGRQWMRATRRTEGLPALTCEVTLWNLPVSLVLSMDMSSRGPSAQFLGLGTTLGAVEDLLGLDEVRSRRPGE